MSDIARRWTSDSWTIKSSRLAIFFIAWDESVHSRGTTRIVCTRRMSANHLIALTGVSAASYCFSDAEPLRLERQASWALLCSADTLPDFHPCIRLSGRWLSTPALAFDYLIFNGPSGIRTHDLLNAIETRSQLRYGPVAQQKKLCLGSCSVCCAALRNSRAIIFPAKAKNPGSGYRTPLAFATTQT